MQVHTVSGTGLPVSSSGDALIRLCGEGPFPPTLSLGVGRQAVAVGPVAEVGRRGAPATVSLSGDAYGGAILDDDGNVLPSQDGKVRPRINP